jgi:hypothetical protein
MGVCAVVSERRGGAAVSSRVVGRPEEGRTVGDRRREPAPRALGDPGLPLVAMLSPSQQLTTVSSGSSGIVSG